MKVSGTGKAKSVRKRYPAATPGSTRNKTSGAAKLTGAIFRAATNPTGVSRPKGVRLPQTHDTSKFVLVYQGMEDPDPKNVDKVVRTLAPAKVSEVLPGTLSVEGDGNRIARIAERLESWSLSSEGLLSSPAPSVTRFDIP